MDAGNKPLPNAYWVLPQHFLAGEYPGSWEAEQTRQRLGRFLDSGFTHFIDLTADGELPPYYPILQEEAAYYQTTVSWERFSIGDFGLPTPEQMQTLLDRLDAILNQGGKVYLHCWGGIGRTGTTVGCYLVRHGMDGAQALEQVNAWCHYALQSPETAEQRAFILNWGKYGRHRTA